ncbi:MAG: nicotinate (nicotinamide) nucleotide adenylyltransferase [Candidatus Cloacimonetes bacterium]|nr:nicotinate (nicotinamide) nucleotide adenylyltransferase [Candidatus Cloacimonadota bacterium]
MKIGLLGGSFDPIHNGHIEIAQAALQQNFVQQVWFIPSYIHPLKDSNVHADFEQRLSLIKKALATLPHCEAHDFEKRSQNPSFTQKLMLYLYQNFPQHEFYFMTGYDIIPDLPKWYNYPWLKENVNFLIITRSSSQNIDNADELKHHQFLHIPPVDISSTQIRNLAAQGKSIHGLVPHIIEPDIIEIYK